MHDPVRQMWLAGGMLLVGAVLPFLIVIRVLPTSLFLSLLAYLCSIGGLFLGMYGLSMHYRATQRDDDGFGM